MDKPSGNGSKPAGGNEGLQRRSKPARSKQTLLEFKQWKRALVEMIKGGATIVDGPGGQSQFLLPPALVKLVWTTTIKERMKLEQRKGDEPREAAKRAIDGIREEVEDAQEKMQAAQPPQVQYLNAVKLSQLIDAWSILHDDMAGCLAENKPITFRHLGSSLERSGVKIVKDEPAATEAAARYESKIAEDRKIERARAEVLASNPEQKERSTEEAAAEEAAAVSLAKYREELLKSKQS